MDERELTSRNCPNARIALEIGNGSENGVGQSLGLPLPETPLKTGWQDLTGTYLSGS